MRPTLYFLVAVFFIAGAQAQPQEVRGVWITNVDSQVMFSKPALADAMDYLADNGFNVVYPVVWNKGYTLYPSDTMEELFGIRLDPALGGRDVLAEIIVEAHRNGMEVIPWFEYGFATEHSGVGTPPQGASHIAQTFPDWLARDVNGDILKKNGFEWMNGLHPGPQDLMLRLIREVLENYDVDGIQGDDRLPAMPSEGGYSDFTRSLYAGEHDGADVPSNPRESGFLQWKADKLTTFGGRVYRMVKEIDDNLLVSFSPSIYPWSVHEYLQDWPTWLDSSYVDIVHPQAYRWDIGAYKSTMQAMIGSAPGVHNGYIDAEHLDKITPGLIIKAGSQFNDWGYVREAVSFNREYDIAGEVYFFYEGLREKNDFLADSLHHYFYQEDAVLPGRDGIRRPGGFVMHETDSRVIEEGEWSESSVSGFEGGMVRAEAVTGTTLTWDVPAPYDGTYEVYAYQPRFRSDATRGAYFVASADSDSVVTIVDQWSTAVQGWVHLGRFQRTAGESVTVRLRADLAADGAASYGDAVMLLLNRKLTPDLVIPTSTSSLPHALPSEGRVVIHPFSPHPTSDSTDLTFTLSDASTVSAHLYDALGRRILTLFDGETLPAGRHRFQADVSALATGVYVCSVRADGARAASSLVVLR
ncbi:MAG: family 10 glycosylhydrolase [Bacteroidota bacterium]